MENIMVNNIIIVMLCVCLFRFSFDTAQGDKPDQKEAFIVILIILISSHFG
jgi:hypothetical protein